MMMIIVINPPDMNTISQLECVHFFLRMTVKISFSVSIAVCSLQYYNVTVHVTQVVLNQF